MAIFQGRGAAQAAIAQTIDAFSIHSKGKGIPQQGTSLLCSSGSKAPSITRLGEKYTAFSSALLHVLCNGAVFQKRNMSLYDVGNLIEDFLRSNYGDEAPRPEVHSPDQSSGDVATLPFFPNIAKMRAQASSSTRSGREGGTRHRDKNYNGNVEFERIGPNDLQSIPVVVQALDHQWISRSLLEKVKRTGYLTASIEKQRVKLARAEYIRTLINSEQLVIDLPYIYNNPVVYQDYSRQGQNREDFKALLDSAVIVPYLYRVKSPAEHPAVTYFDIDYFGFGAWRQLCLETHMQCLRLSWDDKENWSLTGLHLSERLLKFAMALSAGDVETYLRDLNLDKSAERGLRQHLVDLGYFCQDFSNQGKTVTRSDLYKAFVTVGDNPADRRYDSSKPFAGEIKQLVDLSYNCNLSDALGGYLMTPLDSLPRTALQEWQRAEQQSNEITGEELVKSLQRTAFDLVGLVETGLNVKSMGFLSLRDVREIRSTDEWATYMQSLKALLTVSPSFADGGAARIYESYIRLVRQMTDLLAKQDRKDKILSTWTPTIELVFDVGNATLSCTWTAEGPIYQLWGSISNKVSPVAAPVVGRLIIRDMSGKYAQQNQSTSINFMKYKMRDARYQWRDIESHVRKLPGYRELAVPPRKEEIDVPTLNYQAIEY